MKAGPSYGRDEWRRAWGVEIVEEVPKVPDINWGAKDPFFTTAFRENYVLFYVPGRVRFKGSEKAMTMNTLEEIITKPYEYFWPPAKEKLGAVTSHPGWVLMSKTVIPGSRNQTYETQKRMVEAARDFHMPQALEACVLNLMVEAITKVRSYGQDPWTYTRCVEKVEGYPVVVAVFGSGGLAVHGSCSYAYVYYGVACAQRKL